MTSQGERVLTLPKSAGRAARGVAPGFMANRARRHERSLRLRTGVTDLARRIVGQDPAVVRTGCFAGMAYPPGRLPDIDAAVAKLVGTYELEIAWVFERAIAQRVSTFIDIGCADGYYAVGMAHASPGTASYAYDLASSARRLTAETAVASRVQERVQIGSRFTLDALGAVQPDGALLLCDIEGAELELFGSREAAALANTIVVIEVHEDDHPGAGSRLREVFADTHGALTVLQKPRVHVPDGLAPWSPVDRSRALAEFRGPKLHWLVLEPKGSDRNG